MNLGDLLPVFAATDAAAASAERNGKFTEFPDEEPTVKQMNDWLEVNLPVITKSHGELRFYTWITRAPLLYPRT